MARTRRSKNDEDKADEAPTEEVPAGEEESAAPPAADAPEAEAKTEETAAEADEATEKPEDEEAQMTETMETAGSKRQREEPEDTAVAGDGDGEISGEFSLCGISFLFLYFAEPTISCVLECAAFPTQNATWTYARNRPI